IKVTEQLTMIQVQAQLLWQMKDGLCCLLLLRGAVQESLRGAPAARGRRGPLGAAGGNFDIKGRLEDQARAILHVAQFSPWLTQLLPTGHYKAIGVLDDFPPDLLADVSMDFNYRKEWDEFVKELYERECSRETVVYWEVESPSPKFNRDVSFPERHHYSAFKKIHVILAQSTSMPQFSEKLCVIQVRQFKQRLAIQSNGKRGSKVFMYYLDNLDCPVPNWLFKWAAKKGVPTYLKNMVNTCDNYPRRS
ncbi:hypothetical protein EI555_001652, partial [Monodon monoceros]